MMFLPPISKQIKASNAATVITAGIGQTTSAANILIAADASAPKPICSAPINAEALPAFFVNGAKESAEAFGLIKPKQPKNKAIKAMVVYKFSRLYTAANKNKTLNMHCNVNAQKTIFLLLNHLSI
ncbi:hypothetical protein D3C85_1632450 [compost metagenome]